MARSRRTPTMLVSRCSSELSSHQNYERNQKSHSLRPERTRISCYAALDMAACAAFRKESRMKFTNATNLYRKSGEAEGRDLQFSSTTYGSSWKCFRHSVAHWRTCGFIYRRPEMPKRTTASVT